MPKTNQELREWYQKFSKELYEKVQIDVTRKEDLGRVRNFKIISQDVDDPLEIRTEMTYAYIPHDGTKYDVPAPEIGDFPKHTKWLTDNLNPKVTDAEIQKLYDQSCEGTLMVMKPGGSLSNIQMVLTDANGNITVSVPANAYYDKSTPIPADQKVPDAPASVEEPDPAKFGRPQMPSQPKNLNPSWLSRLGYQLFGWDTDYAKLVRYQEAVNDFPNKIAAWEKNPNGQAQEYGQAVAARAAYVNKVHAFHANPYCRLCAIQNGIVAQIMGMEADLENPQNEKFMAHVRQEREYLMMRHAATPLSKLKSELEQLEKRLSYFKQTEQALYDLTGHDPHPERLPNPQAFELKEVKAFYKPEAYPLPPMPNSDSFTMEQEQDMQKSWEELAAVAGFSATSDYDILGSELRPGCNREETADLKYGMVLPNLFMEFRSQINHELPCVEPARKLAKEALYAYSDGNPEQLGKIMARSLRQNMREAASKNQIVHSSTWRTLYLVSKQVEMLDKYPDVREASGLTPEELEEARGYAALYKVMMRGAEAKKDLLEHALGKKTLSSGEMEQAGKDALLASYAFHQVGVSYKEQSDKIENDPVYQQIVNDMAYGNGFTSVEADAKKAEQEGRQADAENLYKTAEKMKMTLQNAKAKHTLFEFNRAAPPIIKNLLNENWVDAAKDQLAKNVELTKILSSGKSIVDAFHSDFDLAMSTKDLVPETKSAQLQKSLEINQPHLQSQVPQNNMSMK